MFNDFPTLHPALVHFPIALLLLAGVFGILSLFLKRDVWKDMAIKSLIVGVIFFPLAVITGLMEEQNLEHNEAVHEMLLTHKYLGITLLFYYQILLLWYWLRKKLIGNKEYITWVLSLLIGSLLIAYQGYLGGEMVFKYGAGVKAMEGGMKSTGGHDHGGSGKMEMDSSTKANGEHSDGGHDEGSMKAMKGMDMKNMKDTDNMKNMPGMDKKDMKEMGNMKDMPAMDKKNTNNMKDMPGMDKKDLKDTNNMKDMPAMDNMKDMPGMDMKKTNNMKDTPGMKKEDMKDMKDMGNMQDTKLIDASKPYDNNPATEKALSVKKNKQ